jgi:hypothetical protein
MLNVEFLTFGGGKLHFKRAAHTLAAQASQSKLFDKVEYYTEKDLVDDPLAFWRDHGNFILKNRKTGFGKYLWKPYIILKKLQLMEDGKILVYLDSGCRLNLLNEKSRLRFENYISYVINNDSLAMQLNDGDFGLRNLSESSWSTNTIMNELELSTNERQSNQIQAGILLLRNSKRIKDFVSKWFYYCTLHDYAFLNDSNPIRERNLNFFSSRYDQSVFSALYKKNRMFTIPDETFFSPSWLQSGMNHPIWAMRLRNGSLPNVRSLSNSLEKFLEFAKI